MTVKKKSRTLTVRDSIPDKAPAYPPDPGQAIVLSGELGVPSGLLPVSRDRSPYWTYLGKFASAHSRRTMRDSLATIAEVLSPDTPPDQIAWHQLRYQHVARIKAVLVEKGFAPATINKHLVALRQILIQCRRLGLITADDCANAIDVASIKSQRLPAGRAASNEEVETLFRSIRRTDCIGMRNKAILALMVYGGLRRSEVVGLKLSAYVPIEEQLTVIGKGDKERIVPVVHQLRNYLGSWLMLRGAEEGLLICKCDRHGNVYPTKSITAQNTFTILDRAAKRAGIPHLSPHDLRRTLITEALDRGVDSNLLSEIVGHNDSETTKRYDRRPAKTRLNAMKAAFNPKKEEKP